MPEPIPRLQTPRLLLPAFGAGDLDAYAGMCTDADVIRRIGPLNPPDGPALESGCWLGREFWGQALAHEGAAAAM